MRLLLKCKNLYECKNSTCPLFDNETPLENYRLPCVELMAEPYMDNSPIRRKKISNQEENRHEPEE